jgi:hypothetical protein
VAGFFPIFDSFVSTSTSTTISTTGSTTAASASSNQAIFHTSITDVTTQTTEVKIIQARVVNGAAKYSVVYFGKTIDVDVYVTYNNSELTLNVINNSSNAIEVQVNII